MQDDKYIRGIVEEILYAIQMEHEYAKKHFSIKNEDEEVAHILPWVIQ